MPMNIGWYCPKCEVMVSPYLATCPMCASQKKEETSKPSEEREKKDNIIDFPPTPG